MENTNTGTIAAIVGIILVALLVSPTARKFFFVIALLFILLAMAPSIFRSKSCALVDGQCFVQPTYAGPCFPKRGSAVLRVGTDYVLTSTDPQYASATCVDWRVWK